MEEQRSKLASASSASSASSDAGGLGGGGGGGGNNSAMSRWGHSVKYLNAGGGGGGVEESVEIEADESILSASIANTSMINGQDDSVARMDATFLSEETTEEEEEEEADPLPPPPPTTPPPPTSPPAADAEADADDADAEADEAKPEEAADVGAAPSPPPRDPENGKSRAVVSTDKDEENGIGPTEDDTASNGGSNSAASDKDGIALTATESSDKEDDAVEKSEAAGAAGGGGGGGMSSGKKYCLCLILLLIVAGAVVGGLFAGGILGKKSDDGGGTTSSAAAEEGVGTATDEDVEPTPEPTLEPTWEPTYYEPTYEPTTYEPTFEPTSAPADAPQSPLPTVSPTDPPSPRPTTSSPTTLTPRPTVSFPPTPDPTFDPTPDPTFSPTSTPVASPTLSPTDGPTSGPTKAPQSKPPPANAGRASLVTLATDPDPTTGLSLTSPDVANDESSPQFMAIRWMSERDGYFSAGGAGGGAEGGLAEAAQSADVNVVEEVKKRYAVAALGMSLNVGGAMTNAAGRRLSAGKNGRTVRGQRRPGQSSAGRELQPTAKFNWFTSEPVCKWEGIVCGGTSSQGGNDGNDGSNVTEIRLPRSELDGSVPTEISAFASSLKYVDLAENDIGGEIPPGLYLCSHLEELYLGNNNIGGGLTEDVRNWNNMYALYLNNNRMTGTLPKKIRVMKDTMRFFSIHSNQFSGEFPLLNLRVLYYLDASYNQFTGLLPLDLGERYRNLQVVYLDHNRFVGPIPNDYIHIGGDKMHELHLNNNRLCGSVPTGFDEMYDYHKFLFAVTVHNNRLTTPLDDGTCKFSVLTDSGELIEMGMDCDVCQCKDDTALCKIYGRCYEGYDFDPTEAEAECAGYRATVDEYFAQRAAEAAADGGGGGNDNNKNDKNNDKGGKRRGLAERRAS